MTALRRRIDLARKIDNSLYWPPEVIDVVQTTRALACAVVQLDDILKELVDAVDLDLGPLDDPEQCLCDVELGGTTCAVCLARKYRTTVGGSET